MSGKQAILHRAEEYGQSRQLESKEVGSHTLMAGIEAVALAGAAGLAVVVFQGIQGKVTWGTLGTAAATGVVVCGFSFAFHVSSNFGQLREGLRSWRSVETFTPPIVEQPTGSSPIVVKPLGGDPYILDGNHRIALPDGRQSGLALNPPTLEAILKEVVREHGGQWSRRRLMSIRIRGERVTRTLYEEMTDALARAGFLLPQPNGGYALPGDVRTYDDLRRYLPGLGGWDGGWDGGTGEGQQGGSRLIEGEQTLNLAERRKQRWLECGCQVEAYRMKRG